MRFAQIALALLISTGSVLESTAAARAQSCPTVPMFKGNPLKGNWQYQLGSNSCTPLTEVIVTVAVTQDIIVDQGTLGYNGFGMQLNANGPSTNAPSAGLATSKLYFTQFVITVGGKQGEVPDVVGGTQQFPSSGASISPNNLPLGKPVTLSNNTFLTIPAGTTFKWTLANDNKSNVVEVVYSAHDALGTNYTLVREYIPPGNQAPIYSLTMDIVGFTFGSYAQFQSGAGTITYIANTFSESYNFPSCAINGIGAYGLGTAEDSNMVYGPLNPTPGGFTQTFSASTVGVFQNGDCGYPGAGYTSGDWARGDYKGQCPAGTPMYGVSRVPGKTWSHAVECGSSAKPGQPITGQAAFSNSGAGCYTQPVLNNDNRGDTDNGLDWDPGSYKTECRANEYVAGVSQASGNGVLTSVLCCPASVTHQHCNPQVFYNSDSRAYSGPDWDVGYYKGQCQGGQYVAGISTPASTSIGTNGAAHAVLCCSR